MLRRYAVVAGAMLLWSLLSVPAWIVDPLAPAHLYGAPGTVHLLTLGVIGFVVLGTLYHVVPFIVWVHRYSDLLGLEEVPMIDDLYDDRLAATDFGLLFVGAVGLVVADLFAVPAAVRPVFGGAILLGSTLFAANMWLVLRRHGPGSVADVFRGQTSG
jgi:cbb3-type cytochrome oxidase subunit 1